MNTPYTIRNYTRADFNRFVLFYLHAEETEPAGRAATPQAFAEMLSRPGSHPEEDIFIAEASGEIIGFLDVIPEAGISRLVVDGWVIPEHRRRGLGTRLLGLAGERARHYQVSLLHVSVREDNTETRKLLSRLGFACVRTFHELEIDTGAIAGKELDGALRECRHMQSGEVATLTDIQNRSFSETWGYNPNTVATIAYRMGLSHHSSSDIILRGEGGKVTGYCWTEVTADRRGRIFMIGSAPEHRGKGIGKKLLVAGLAHLRRKGVQNVWLTVDSANEAALSLYESVGFTRKTNYLWYEASAGKARAFLSSPITSADTRAQP